MMRSILACTDLSHRSDRAVRRAFRLAAEHGARLTVVTVVDDDLPEEISGRLRDEAEKAARRFCESIGDDGVDWAVRSVLGDPAPRIAAEALEAEADLVVLGTHRSRPFADIFTQTTMERVVRATGAPALLVRDQADHPYRRVLAAIALSPASAAAVRAAAEAAPDAELSAFHAFHVAFRGYLPEGGSPRETAPYRAEAEAAVQEWRAASDLPARLGEIRLIEGSVARALGGEVDRVEPDLLAIGAHGRSGLAPALLGSLAQELIYDPPCDVLVAGR